MLVGSNRPQDLTIQARLARGRFVLSIRTPDGFDGDWFTEAVSIQ